MTAKPTLKVIRGGKDNTVEPPSDNWLINLSAGTTFVAKVNDKTIDYELYHVVFKTIDAVLLRWQLPDEKQWDRWVDSKEFSKRYPHYILLGEPQQQESDNDGNRKCNLGGLPDVVLHEAVQRVDQVVPETE